MTKTLEVSKPTILGVGYREFAVIGLALILAGMISVFTGFRSAPVLLWLAIISYFDLRTREVPHAAWIGIPAACAALWRVSQGGWPLALTALLLEVVSEHRHFSSRWAARAWNAAPLALALVVIVAGRTIYPTQEVFIRDYLIPAVGIIVFWQLYERKQMGGPDSLTAITLLLLWPGWLWTVLWIVAAVLYSLAWRLAGRVSWRANLSEVRLPGLPVMLLATILYLGVTGVR